MLRSFYVSIGIATVSLIFIALHSPSVHASSFPSRLIITKIGQNSLVVPVGVDEQNAMSVPTEKTRSDGTPAALHQARMGAPFSTRMCMPHFPDSMNFRLVTMCMSCHVKKKSYILKLLRFRYMPSKMFHEIYCLRATMERD